MWADADAPPMRHNIMWVASSVEMSFSETKDDYDELRYVWQTLQKGVNLSICPENLMPSAFVRDFLKVKKKYFEKTILSWSNKGMLSPQSDYVLFNPSGEDEMFN